MHAGSDAYPGHGQSIRLLTGRTLEAMRTRGRCLEVQLESELQLTHPYACAGDSSESGNIAQIIIGIAPARMVRGIERLEAELQVGALREVEVLQQRSVPLNQTRPDHGIAPGRAVRAESWQLKRRGIEPLVGRTLIAVEVRRANLIGTIEPCAGVRSVGPRHYRYREARLDRQQ